MRLTISRLQPTRLANSAWVRRSGTTLCAGWTGNRQLLQALVEAAIDIDEGQVARIARRQAQAPNYFGQQRDRKLGLLGDKREQGGAGNHRAYHRLQRDDAGRAWPAVECHFTHIFARSENAKSDFLVGGSIAEYLDAANQHDEDAVPQVTFVDQDGAFSVAPRLAPCSKRPDGRRMVVVCDKAVEFGWHLTIALSGC